jgi:hypothetical protein
MSNELDAWRGSFRAGRDIAKSRDSSRRIEIGLALLMRLITAQGENDELSSISEINTEFTMAPLDLSDWCRSSRVEFCTDFGVGDPGLRGTC